MGYYEGDLCLNNGYGNNGMWGGDGIWAILLLALLGNRGFGFGGGAGYGTGYGAGSEFLGYELGKVATTNDVASGFSTSEIMSDLNSIIVGQANMQNWINQGFYGIDRSVLQGFHGVDNAICTLGYQNQQGFNALGHQISDCCCKVERAIDGVNYNMARNTCDIIQAINAGNQRLVDIYTSDKIDTLNRKLSVAENQLSQNAQTSQIISTLRPTAIPAYITCSPYQSAYGFYGNNNGCCGCGNF